METTINQVIEYYARSSVQFVNGFINSLGISHKDTGRRTARGVCGIVVPLCGRANFSFDGTTYAVNGHTVLHAGSSMDIEIEAFDRDWEYAVIHYRIVEAPAPFEGMLHRHFSIAVQELDGIRQAARQLVGQQHKPDYMSKLQMQASFMRLLERILLSAREGGDGQRRDVVTGAMAYIHQHYDRDLSVGDLAQLFGMERRRFTALFERLTGWTPNRYMTECRISRAKDLLMLTNKTVAEIAEAVGYPDCFYFSRVFKKTMNMSPSAYRKDHLGHL